MKSSMIKVFEKELKNKVAMKTSGRLTEESVLLKAFKYFDLDNTGYCDQKKFIQTLLKIGITGFSDDNLREIYNYYSNGNPDIDYKEYVGILYNNQSIINEDRNINTENISNQNNSPQKNFNNFNNNNNNNFNNNNNNNFNNNNENNNNNNENQENVYEKIKMKLMLRGISGLIALENNFRNLDEDNSQTIGINQFKKCLNNFRFNLPDDDIIQIFSDLDQEQTGKINYDEFIRVVRGEIPENRKKIVENIFYKVLDKNKNGNTNLEIINNEFVAKNHPDVLNGKKNEEEILQEFINTFEGNHYYLNGDDGTDGIVDLNEFIDYYESVSSFIKNDDDFENLVNCVWGIKQPKMKSNNINNNNLAGRKFRNRINNNSNQISNQNSNQNSPFKNNNNNIIINNNEFNNNNYEQNSVSNTNQNNNFPNNRILIKLRNNFLNLGLLSLLNLARQFKIFDDNGTKTLSFDEFKNSFLESKIPISQTDLKNLFETFSKKNLIDYPEFLSSLLGELNERRLNVVLSAFSKMDLDKSGILEFNEIKTFFNTKNNPLVLNGSKTEEEVYTDFVQSFQIHHNITSGIRNKNVSLDEFIDYYKYVSVITPNDELFEGIVMSAWKIKEINVGKYDNLYNKKMDNVSNSEVQSLKENLSSNNNNNNFNNNFNNRKPYVKQTPWGVDDEPVDYSTYSQQKGGRKLFNKTNQDNFSNYNYNNNNNNFNNNNNNNNYNDNNINNNYNYYYRKNNQQQNKKIEDPFLILKNTIKKRGTRGIMSLLRYFMIANESYNHTINFDLFDQYLKDYRIPISEEDEKKIFEKFDINKSGLINYDNLVNEIIGELNDFRQDLIIKIFEKFDPNQSGFAYLSDIRNGFNEKNHPHVLSGKKNEQEVLSEFLDNLDYYFNLLNQNKLNDDGMIEIKDFIEFYKIISGSIENDKEFENIVCSVWDL
jgi:Ca2+-binding EF-hand superfamily protein